ncbi:MAG: translocation/assembly module TamB domain-containing protein, partial [Parvularcula sp.]|nr:translocation/assembly module TamB domain-containing protein [Parvularcula sp.]
RLRFEENEIGKLTLNAQGPRDAIAADLAASDVTAGPIFFTNLLSTVVVDIENSRARIEDLIAQLVPADQQVALAEPTVVEWSDGFRLQPSTFDYLGGSQLNVAADIGPERWVLDLSGTDVPIPRAEARASFDIDLDTEAEVPATVTLTAVANTEEEDYAFSLDGRWTGEEVIADSKLLRDGTEEIGSLEAKLPLRLLNDGGPSIEYTGDGLDARLRYDDRIESIYAFLPLTTQPLTGDVAIDVSVSGRPDTPQTDGKITINGARFEESSIGLALTDLNGSILFNVAETGSEATIDITGSGASGRDNSVRLSGVVDTIGADSSVDIKLNLDSAQVARSSDLELRTTADLSLAGSFQELTLSGPIVIEELDIQIPDLDGGEDVPDFAPVNVVRTDAPQEERAEEVVVEPASPLVVNLDISIDADDRIFVRGRGLESEWAADLNIGGTTDEPLISGSVNLIEGILDLAGREFELTRGVIGFRGNEEIVPALNIRAETEAGDGVEAVTAIVTVTGTADNPEIGFSSIPSLPEEDILALILFGRPANSLGAGEAIQLAQAAATLTGAFGSGGGVVGSVRSGLGLDRLSIDPTGRALTVGKYISEDIYVSARQSIGQLGTALSVVYEVSNFFTVEATQKANGAQALSANYKRDY